MAVIEAVKWMSIPKRLGIGLSSRIIGSRSDENSIPDFDALLDALHITGSSRLGLAEQLYATEERYAHYAPVLRFILLNPEQRRFGAERMCYRSRVNGWLKLGQIGPLKTVSRTLISTLGTDQFFELYLSQRRT